MASDRRLPDVSFTARLTGAVHSYVATLPPPHGANCRCVAYFTTGLPLKSEDACAEGRPITTREIDRG